MSWPGLARLVCISRPVAQHPHLGVLPDGAGVDDNQVGLRLALGELVPHLAGVAPQPLESASFCWQPWGCPTRPRARTAGRRTARELLAEIPLAVRPRGNSGRLSIQAGSSKRYFNLKIISLFLSETQAETPFVDGNFLGVYNRKNQARERGGACENAGHRAGGRKEQHRRH